MLPSVRAMLADVKQDNCHDDRRGGSALGMVESKRRWKPRFGSMEVRRSGDMTSKRERIKHDEKHIYTHTLSRQI